MDSGLTIIFPESFWVGYFYVNIDDYSEAARFIFGSSEPTEAEIYQFILREYHQIKYSQPIFSEKKCTKSFNTKTAQRKAKKYLSKECKLPRSLETLKKQQEIHKVEKQKKSAGEKKQEQYRKFSLKQLKKKKKKRGH